MGLSLRSPFTHAKAASALQGVGAAQGTQAHALDGTLVLDGKRLLVQRDHVVFPFVWRGLFPLVGLAVLSAYALGPFAQDAIEGSVQSELRATLDATGHAWAAIGVDGQSIVLSGTPPTPAAAQAAVGQALAATCSTWLGKRRCTNDVLARFTAASMPANPAVVVPRVAPSFSTVANPGAAPTGASSQQIITTKEAPKLRPEDAQSAQPDSNLSASECESRLAQLMSDRTLEFVPSSAVLNANSAFLLDDLAREAKRCTGTIRIDVHALGPTKSANPLRLSIQRAFAVRDALVLRGVAADRLVAEGAATQPMKHNPGATATSQRPVEFRVVESNSAR
jgi:outer membrane protein OmpA-like peptidoglycan-associated protein